MNADRLIEAARSVRVDGHALAAWSVYVAETRRASVGTKDLRTGDPHAPLTLAESLTARYKLVWDDGRVSRGVMERRAIEHEPAAALRTARAASFPDPDATEVCGPAAFPEVATRGAVAGAIALGETAEWAPRHAAIRECVTRHGIRTWSGSMQAAEGSARVITSSGLDVASSATTTSWSATFDGELGAGHAGREVESLADLQARLDRLVAFVLALREPSGSSAGGVRPVILHPDVVEEYVMGVLLHNLDGAQVAHGTGAFRKEQFGSPAPVLREDLTLRHDPLVPMAAGAYRFTQEGVPALPCTYVGAGRLQAPLCDLKYARRLGRRPTSIPSSMDTLFFEGAPALSYDDALAAAGGGALVLSVLGIHTQDHTSGDFSLSAPQTLAIGDGGRTARMRATISGNVFEVLRSKELEFVRFPGEHTPGLLTRCRLDTA